MELMSRKRALSARLQSGLNPQQTNGQARSGGKKILDNYYIIIIYIKILEYRCPLPSKHAEAHQNAELRNYYLIIIEHQLKP